MKTSKTNPDITQIPVGFHAGAIIMILSEQYNSIPAVVNEAVQNLLDANAKTALIILNLVSKKLHVFDDGEGTSLEAVQKQLAKVGARFKSKDKAGEKNIGKFAAISIAQRSSFTSHPRDARPVKPYFQLKLDRTTAQDEDVSFTSENLGVSFKFGEQSWATSLVAANDIENSAIDALMKNPDPLTLLCDTIAETFCAKLKEVKTKIVVKVITKEGTREKVVTPQAFPGLRELRVINTSLGPVTFEVFLTRNPQKSPKILVNHRDAVTFPLRNLPVWKTVSEVLACGHIQGIITTSFCDINSNKNGFKHDNSLQIFQEAVVIFTEQCAKPWKEDLAQQKDDEIFVEVGRNVANAFAAKFKEFEGLQDSVFGAVVSGGHVGTDDDLEDGKVSTFKKDKKKDSDVPPLPCPKKDDPKEKDIIHTGVASKKGSKRKEVRGQCGLVLFPGEGTAGWMAKVGKEGEEKGKIVINLVHPCYRAAQNKGKAHLDNYLRHLVGGILTASMISDKTKADAWYHEYEGGFMQGFCDVMAPTIPGKPKAEK